MADKNRYSTSFHSNRPPSQTLEEAVERQRRAAEGARDSRVPSMNGAYRHGSAPAAYASGAVGHSTPMTPMTSQQFTFQPLSDVGTLMQAPSQAPTLSKSVSSIELSERLLRLESQIDELKSSTLRIESRVLFSS